MAIEDFGGSVLGKPIEFLVADHQNKVDVGLAIRGRSLTPRGDLQLSAIDITNSGRRAGVRTSPSARPDRHIQIYSSSDLTGKACSPNGDAVNPDDP